MTTSGPHLKRSVCLAWITILLLVSWGCAYAMDGVTALTFEPEKLELIAGKSIILKGTRPFSRISEPAKEIASAIALSPTEIYLTGKSAGVTNLILWQDKKVAAVYDIEVIFEVSRLKQALYEMLPYEKNLLVNATHNGVTLSGRVSSQESLNAAMSLAEAFVPKKEKSDKKSGVTNLVEVGGIHQVMLEVRVAEMSKTLARRLGVNLGYFDNGNFGLSTLGGLSQVVKPDDAVIGLGGVGLDISPAVNAIFRFTTGTVTWTSFIDALREDGMIKILAEPTLIALSGQPASFLAGGEFPVPVPQGLGTVAIEYKEFGVGLVFTPTVINEKKINIKVAPEVSELDFATSVQLAGFLIPGLSTRKASTVVELADGQSFAIAGLLSENVRSEVNKFPLLGDIPILGVLFRSEEFQKKETELIIIVTPHLVKPLDLAHQTLPTDFYIEPNGPEFYLEGKLLGRERPGPLEVVGKLDGEFGYAAPGSQ